MKFLVSVFMWAVAPLRFGGGGGDGGAAEARQQEDQRQARIKAAVDTINAVFNGQQGKRGVGAATTFDPNATYYDAHGNTVTVPKITSSEMDPNDWEWVINGTPRRMSTVERPDQNWFDQQVKAGNLFTGTEQYGATGDRDALYRQQKDAVFDLNKRDIDKQFQDAERQNRFGLARAGLLGGSADVDSNAQLQEKTNEGLVKAAALADQSAADLKTADERTRQSLISMAQSGIDTGTAQSMALRNLDANAQTAAGNRAGATIGGLFGDLSQAYLMNRMATGQNAGINGWQQKYPNLAMTGGDKGTINGGRG